MRPLVPEVAQLLPSIVILGARGVGGESAVDFDLIGRGSQRRVRLDVQGAADALGLRAEVQDGIEAVVGDGDHALAAADGQISGVARRAFGGCGAGAADEVEARPPSSVSGWLPRRLARCSIAAGRSC